ncbi:GH17130 [Drosophila grimshawi]|uniref:GH17130 n=2 Tax=Drosophila grimshawi TaxID=7222 RepID=B4J0P5_DROGR|nr:GH17130 [Drosophila grimshawi]
MPTGYYEYPYDCAAYISCNDSQTELRYCAPGKLFNEDLQICDTPEAVNCSESEYPDDCVDQANGAVLPSLEHCDQFIVCINHQVVLHTCPEHYLFNPNLLVCDEPDEAWCYAEQSTEMTTTTNTATTTTTATTTNTAPKVTSEDNNPCQDQDLGASFPYAEDCQQYILCLGNDQSVQAKCPFNSWYDPATGNCGPAVPPTACQETTTTSTTPKTTPSPSDLCAGQELGVSYPFVSNCQRYILCLGNGDSVIANCIYNAWYDPATGDCGQDVSPTACQESLQTTTTESTTQSTTQSSTQSTSQSTTQSTTIEPTTTEKPISSDICAGKVQGEYVNYPDNCSKYIVCAEPVPVAFYCTYGYYFSEALQQCVDWEQSDCEATSSTVLPPGDQPTPSPGTCKNGKDITFPYPGNCQWYFRCVNDNVFMLSVCNSGEYYDPWSGECGANVPPNACLEDYTTSTLDLDTTTTEMITLPTPTTTPQPHPCEGVTEGKLVPYPNDCTKFIECTSAGPVAYDCVVGQEFSAILERCMAPWVANCSFATTITIATPTTTTQVAATTESNQSTDDDFCEGKADGSLIPYPNNCTKYIVCQEPIAVAYVCPGNEQFSPTHLLCMDAQAANCISKKTHLI